MNAQLVIFSLIVAVIVGLSYLISYRVSKEEIKKEVELKVDGEIKKIERKEKDLVGQIAESLEDQKSEIRSLRSTIYRTLGQFWDSEKSYSTAFIWWIRAAHSYSKVEDEELTRICLSNARDSVSKIEYAFQLDTNLVGEFQNLFADIDDGKYKIEKDLLSLAVKNKLTQQLK